MGAATDRLEVLALRRMKHVTHQIGAVGAAVALATDGNWYMLVDLSNASGAFPHRFQNLTGGGEGIHLYGAQMAVKGVDATDQWRTELAVVLRVDGTDADLAVFSPGAGFSSYFPMGMDLTVASGALSKAYASKQLNDAGVQDDVNLVDAGGANVLPAVGDLLWRVVSDDGAPAGNIAYAEASVWYEVNRAR